MATRRKEIFAIPDPSPALKLYRNDSVEFGDAPPLLEDITPASIALGDFIYPDVVARQACFWGSLVFGFIGAIEYFFPQAAGLPLTRYHSSFYLISGAALVLPAMMLAPKSLGKVSVALGIFFAVLGFLGFFMGAPASLGAEEGAVMDRFHWALVPGRLEFSTRDHILQEIIGVILVLVGLRAKRRDRHGGLDISIK